MASASATQSVTLVIQTRVLAEAAAFAWWLNPAEYQREHTVAGIALILLLYGALLLWLANCR